MKKLKIRVGKMLLSLITKISPTLNSKILFIMRTHKVPNLKNPSTFNEKTTWLKLNKYNKSEQVSKLADKFEVRKYIEKMGYGETLNELYGVYDHFEDIDFTSLPDKFVIKCTHGCNYNIICSNKKELDINKSGILINKWMKEKYGCSTSELHYTKIKPRIVVEKYLCDKNGKVPKDYKFYCMNGKVKCILVCSERDERLKLSYYDLEWNRLNYEKPDWSPKEDITVPKNLSKMIEIAQIISGDYPFVRVDFYNDNGNIIFGEMTFTPACSCAPYYSEYGDIELGEMLKID